MIRDSQSSPLHPGPTTLDKEDLPHANWRIIHPYHLNEIADKMAGEILLPGHSV